MNTFDQFDAAPDVFDVTPPSLAFDVLDQPRTDLSTGNGPVNTQPNPIADTTPSAVVAAAGAVAVAGAVAAASNKTDTEGTNTETPDDKPVRNTNKFARRRAIALGVIAAVVILSRSGDLPSLPSLSSLPAMSSVQAATPGKPSEATVAKASAILTSMLDQATNIQATTGSYQSIIFPDYVQVMKSDHMLVLSVVIDGSCWYAAAMPGIDRVPRWDPTAVRCSLDRSRIPQAPATNR